jgi:hypothetical protein
MSTVGPILAPWEANTLLGCHRIKNSEFENVLVLFTKRSKSRDTN